MPNAHGKGGPLQRSTKTPQVFPPMLGLPGGEPLPDYRFSFPYRGGAVPVLLFLENNLTQNQIIGTGDLTIDILPELQYMVRGSYSYVGRERREFEPLEITGINNLPPSGAYDTDLRRHYVGETTLTYDKTFDEVHDLTLLAGYTAEAYEFHSSYMWGQEYPGELVKTLNAAKEVGGSTYGNENTLLSYLGRVSYNYDDRYLINFNVRRDGSSKFGEDNKWGWFPSISGAWRISNEAFFDSGIFSNLKLRASYGEMGNNQIGNYTHIASLGLTQAAFGQDESLQSGYYPSNLGNSNLTWETIKATNVGVNVGLFENRISLVADAYRNVTTDLLLNVDLPAHTGFGSQIMNIGSVLNQGIEFEIKSRNFVGEGFNWTTSLTLDMNENEVLELGPNDAPILSGAWYGQKNYTKVGEPIGSFYLLQQIDTWDTWEEIENNPSWDGARPGDPRIKDANGDGEVNDNDHKLLGRVMPKYNFGLSNTFRYKNFDLTVFIEGSGGNQVMSILAQRAFGKSNSSHIAKFGFWRDFWEGPDDPGDPKWVPEPNENKTGAQGKWTDRALMDATYQRLKNVTLGYTLPENLTQRIGLSKVRIALEGHNVWLNDNAPYVYTPEAYSESEGDPIQAAGYDYVSYPLPRQFLIGVDVTF